MHLNRRDLLRFASVASLAALGVATGDLARAADPPDASAGKPAGDPRTFRVKRPAEACIWIQLAGGFSHLDTFDPKPGREVMGSTTTIASAIKGVPIASSLPRLAACLDRFALVRSLHSNQGAHEQGEYLMRTGFQMRGTIRHPTMGAWMARTRERLDPTLPSYVAVSPGSQHPGAGFLSAAFAPLPIGNPEQGLPHARHPDPKRLDHRLEILAAMESAAGTPGASSTAGAVEQAYQAAYSDAVALMRSPDLAAFDLAQETPESNAAYGDSPFAKGLHLARRLVEHRIRFVEVTFGGWDTHDDNFDRVESQSEILDQALSSLIGELERSGQLERTLIVVASEFGRSPKINQNEGRDHHPACFTGLLAGGPIRAGQTYGASDQDGEHPAQDPVSIADFHATIGAALGLPLTEVFSSPDKRPFTIGAKGHPVLPLLV